MLDHGADLQYNGDESDPLLVVSVRNGDLRTTKLLLERGADMHQRTQRSATTPLEVAVQTCNQKALQLMLKFATDLKSDLFGKALQTAALLASMVTKMLETMLAIGVNANAYSGEYGSALQAASAHANYKAAEMLLHHGAHVNYEGGIFGSALQAAAFRCPSPKETIFYSRPFEEQKLVQLLLGYGADVNMSGGYFGTALQAASFAGRESVVLMLLDAGAQINPQSADLNHGSSAPATAHNKGVSQLRKFFRDGNGGSKVKGLTALTVALLRGFQDIVDLLLQAGAKGDPEGGLEGGLEGQEASLTMLEPDKSCNFSNKVGWGEVPEDFLSDEHVTSQEWDPKWALEAQMQSRTYQELSQEFLDNDVDTKSPSGRYGNALQAASSGGHENIARILIDRGADVNAQGGLHGNALQAAVAKGNASIAELLLHHGPQVNAEGGDYGTALLAAVMGGHKELTKLLIDAGVDVNAFIDLD